MSKLIFVTIFLFCGSTAFDNYDGYVVKDIPRGAVEDYYRSRDAVNAKMSTSIAIQERQKLLDHQRESIEAIKHEVKALSSLRNQVLEVL